MPTNKMEFNKTYPRRPGSDDLGRDYEIKITALLALRCATMNDTKNLWLVSNVDQVGDFDDVVVCKETTDGKNIAYMIQLKHQETPKNITQHDFNYSPKDKGKREKSKEDFSLAKYCKGYIALMKVISEAAEHELEVIRYLHKADRIVFVLYTNKGVNDCEYLEKSHDDSTLSFLNTSEEDPYKFNHSNLNYEPDFIQRLVLFTHQIHLKDANKLIQKEIQNVLSTVKVTNVDLADVTSKFVDFIKIWAKGIENKKSKIYYTLTKFDIIHKLIEIILEPYKLDFSKALHSSNDCPQKHIWSEICDKNTLVDYDQAVVFFLKEYLGTEVKKYCPEVKRTWSDHLSKQFQKVFYENRSNILCLEDISLFDIYERLCFEYKLPFLLQIDALQDYQNIANILKLSPNIRVIVINNDDKEVSSKKDTFVSLRDLSKENIDKILNQPVKLQGRSSLNLSEVLDESMYKFLKCRDIIKVLLKEFSIGNDYDPLNEYLIERSLSKVFLEREILRQVKQDLFVVQNDPHGIYACYENVISYSDVQQAKSENKTVHTLTYHNEYVFEWKKSFGSLKNIRQFQTQQLYENFYMTQLAGKTENLWTPVDDILNDEVRVISSDPGSGKTVLMTAIANRSSVDFWVLKVSLNEHEDYYDEVKNATASEHLNYFNDQNVCSNKELSRAVFQKFLSKKRIFLLLDGFDEISIIHKNQVTSIAKSLQAEGLKIFITTRPVMKSYLEEMFNTFSIDLKPFTKDDQKTCLTTYFSSITKSTDSKNNFLQQFTQELLQAAEQNLYSAGEFTGIPLQTRLLADVFSDEYKKSLRTNRINFNKNFDILYLFEEFTKKKIDILCDKFGKDAKRTRIIFKKHQQLFSLKVIFQTDSSLAADLSAGLNLEEELEELYENKTEQMQFLQREGVVVPTSGGCKLKFNVNFVHRTFAEYSAAQWLVENMENKDDSIRKTVRLLVLERFKEWNPNRFLFKLFDELLIKGCQPHTNVVRGHLEELKDDVDLDVLDKSGRSVLHMIALHGTRHPLSYYRSIKTVNDKMLDIIDEIAEVPDLKDKVLGYNPLDYAIESGCLAVANKLCEKNPDLTINLKVGSFKRSRYFTYCAVLGYEALFKLLVPYFAARDMLLWHNTDRRVFIQSYCHLVEDANDDQEIKDRHFYDYVRNFGVETIGDLFLFKSRDIESPFPDFYCDLRFAVFFGSFNNVELLLAHGFDPNQQDVDSNTPLHYASERKQVEVVRMLLAQGADVDKLGNENNTALHNAAKKGHNEVVEELLAHNAKINQMNDEKQTPLHLAVGNGHLNTVNLLLLNGADSNIETKDGSTLLHYAAFNGATDLISELLTRNPHGINKQDHNGFTPLHLASSYKTEAVKLLILNGADCNIEDKNGNTPLHHAALVGNVDSVTAILTNDPHIDKQNKKEATALHLSSRQYLNTTKLLLVNGANPNIKDKRKETPLFQAIEQDQIEIVSELLFAGADVNATNILNDTPLTRALLCRKIDIVMLLLSHDANIHIKDSLGNCALLTAIAIGNNEMVRELLSRGADLNTTNNFKSTPLHFALSHGHPETAKLLLSKGARWDVVNVNGNVPLHLAAVLGNLELILELLNRGSELNKGNDVENNPNHEPLAKNAALVYADIQNNDGKSPLHLAVIDIKLRKAEDCERCTNCVRLLLEKGADVNLKDKEGNTPLHYASVDKSSRLPTDRKVAEAIVNCFYKEVILLFIEKGVNVSIRNKKGKTALDLAGEAGYKELVEVLQMES